MSLAEHVYRVLLGLYPDEHRRAYEQPMLQHARDLGRAARQRGRWHVVKLCLQLVKDGVVNAFIEHMEGGMMEKRVFKPTPWVSVLLASVPGLLIALSRRYTDHYYPLLQIFGVVYLGLLVLAVPVIYGVKRKFPVWALLPAGALAWHLVFVTGLALAEQVNILRINNLRWVRIETVTTLLQLLLVVVIFVVVLRKLRVPGSFRLILGAMVLGNILMAILYSSQINSGERLVSEITQYFTSSGMGMIEGLMLVAIGLLAARQHGVLAILVMVGGYSYMFLDSDYLFGYPRHEWAWFSIYLLSVTALFLVIVPVALLRSKTMMGRAMAVFVPVVTFHAVRITLPFLVIQPRVAFHPGEVVYSINILLSLILAWILYNQIGKETHGAETDLMQQDPGVSPANLAPSKG